MLFPSVVRIIDPEIFKKFFIAFKNRTQCRDEQGFAETAWARKEVDCFFGLINS
jgi:hypothetical protein